MDDVEVSTLKEAFTRLTDRQEKTEKALTRLGERFDRFVLAYTEKAVRERAEMGKLLAIYRQHESASQSRSKGISNR